MHRTVTKTKCVRVRVGGMANVLQLIERQRERKANRSVASSHNISGYDDHCGSTFTVGLLNTSHDVDRSHHAVTVEPQQPRLGAYCGASVGRRQPCADVADESVTLNHIRHRVDEPVLLRSEANSLWKKDGPPKVIPRKVASMPASSHQSMCGSTSVKCCLQGVA